MKGRGKRKKKPLRWLIFVLLIIALPSLLYFLLMPDVSRLKRENPKKTALMEYREDEAKEKGKHYKVSQTWVPLSQVSPYLVKAILIAEDDKFYRHEGFDFEAIQNALEKDIKAKQFKFGGSTISQQLARNLYLSPKKNLLRKILEAFITWRMEKVLPKKRILELYLNVVEWGEGIFGIEAASRRYYGKAASALSPPEAARLAAVLPNPRKYIPTSDQRYVIHRSNLIYSIMMQRGIIPPEYEDGKGESNLSAAQETPRPPPGRRWAFPSPKQAEEKAPSF